jgi:membrane protein DedA with SNARE-associated domain
MGGALAHRGHMTFAAAAAAVTVGAAIADQTLYHFSRARRDSRLVRRLTSTPAAERILGIINRQPALASAGFRFVWGTRTIGPVVIGAAGVSPGVFVPLNLLAVTVWGVGMTAIGYGAGAVLEAAFGRLPLPRHLAVVAGIAAAVGLAAWVARRKARHGVPG